MTVSNKMFIFVNKINHNQYENKKNQLTRNLLLCKDLALMNSQKTNISKYSLIHWRSDVFSLRCVDKLFGPWIPGE